MYNGVRVSDYRFEPLAPPDAPLVFLGRLEPLKGAHNAIALAKATGRRLVLAGNVVPEHEDYFHSRIQPYLGDGIDYIGPWTMR